MAIRIVTNNVHIHAQNIGKENSKLKNGFVTLEKDLKAMNDSWVSEGKDAAQRCFDSIKKKYADLRFDLVDNFVQVLDGASIEYEKAEQSISNVSGRFK